MSGMAAVLLVARRELRERLRQRSFAVSTAVTAAILVLLAVLPAALGSDDASTYDVGVVGAAAADVGEALRPAPGSETTIEVRAFEGRSDAETALRAGAIDAAIVDDGVVVVDEALDGELGGILGAGARTAEVVGALRAAGVDEDEAGAVAEGRPLPVEALDPPDEAAEIRFGLVNIGTFLLYLQLIGYGFWVASGVVEEKATRVVEVVLAKVRPSQLLAGKVLGIGIIGFAQLLLFVSIGLGAAIASGSVDPPPGLALAALEVLAWFILGYSLYSCAFAVAGAIASRQEEVQNTSSPLTFLLVGSFIAAVTATGDPEGPVATVASLIPFSAPLVMPLRNAAGAAAGWEVALSIGLVLATIAVLIPVAGRVYAGGALEVRSRIKLRTAWSSARTRSGH